MALNSKLSRLLSDFFLDIAKAYFIATFIGSSLLNTVSIPEVLMVLTKTIFSVILFILISWQFAMLEEEK